MRIYKITIIGILIAAAAAAIAAKSFAVKASAADPIIVAEEVTQLSGFSAKSIKNATLEDESESYSGEAYLSAAGTVTHPEWFEGDKLIKADNIYYLIKAKAAPDYSGGSFSDSIDIGDPESEQGAAFACVYASEPQVNAENGETYRTLSKNGAMVLNLKCDPEEINYLTVRLWGSDTGDTILWICDPETGYMNAENTRQPHRNDLIDRRDWVELNYNASTPQYDGGFIYATYEIPEIYTVGREYVSLRLYSTGGPSNYSSPSIKEQTEPSRGIYDVFMTQEPAFDPADFGIYSGRYSGDVENLFDIGNSDDMEYQRAALKSAVESGIAMLRQWQIYGEEAPSYMQGMITRTDWRSGMPDNESDWKNRYYTSSRMLTQNLTPLNMLELAAYAYNHAEDFGLTGDEKEEMLDRVVLGVDFLCRAQGSNGGFYSSDGWIGGPDRREASGNNLTGFGLRSAGKAILDISGSLTEELLNEPIDSDADGTADTVRRDAWNAMLKTARDYLITIEGGYGHAPNQDMANSIAALRFDAVLKNLGGSTLTRGKYAKIFAVCFGDEKNPATSSFWISPKGTILENFGSVQGGYSGDYGSAAIAELSQLAEIGKLYYSYNYSGYIARVYDAIDNYYFIGKKLADGVFVPQEYTEGLISNRNAYYPGTERYPIDLYGALTLNNDTALKIIANYLEQQDIRFLMGAGNDLEPSNVHFEDNVLDAAYLYAGFDEIISAAAARDINSYQFITEDDSIAEYAWADEMARNVVIKDGDALIYMALNWRNPAYSTTIYNTADSSDQQSVKANNLCRVHAKNSLYDSYGYAAMTTDGYSDWTAVSGTGGAMEALMTLSYGDYVIIMNSYNCGGSGNRKDFSASDFEAQAGLDRSVAYTDLISGDVYSYSGGYWHSGGNIMQAASNSTLVLKADRTFAATAPQLKDGKVSTAVTNNTGAAQELVIYTAEYDESGVLKNVEQTEMTVQPGETEIELPAAGAQRAFIWDKRMRPLDE